METLKSYLNFKVGMLTLVGVFALTAGVLALAPRKIETVKADCPIYDYPVFNPFDVTYANQTTGCQDFPVVSGNVQGAGSWEAEFNANVGDTLHMQIYVHNGAAENSGATMHDVRVNTDIPTAPGSRQVITTTLSASNAQPQTKTGQVVVNIPAGAHLEFVSGQHSPYIGDLQGCFEFARTFDFYLRVVGPVVTPPTGEISANIDGQVAGQCLWYARVVWSTSGENADPVQVKVKDLTLNGPEQLMAAARDGNTRVDWIEPNHRYRFNLYILGDYSQAFRFAEVTGPPLDCNPPAQPSGNITATVGARITGQCLYTGNVNWSTTNVSSALVTVDDLDDSLPANNHSTATSGDNSTPWLTPSHRYLYILYNTTSGQTELDRATITVPPLNCSTPTPTGDINGTVGARITGQCLYTGTISWNTQNVSSALVTVDDLDDSLAPQGHSIDITGDNTTPWLTPSHRYLYVLYNTSSGTRVELDRHSFTVPPLDCSTPPPVVTCPAGPLIIVTPSTFNVGQTAQVSIPSGWANAVVTSNNTFVATVSGLTITGRNPGTTLISARATAPNGATNCNLTGVSIQVNPVSTPTPPPALVCTPSYQTVTLNSSGVVSVNFSVYGGTTGLYSWTASGGNPASRSASTNSNFSTTYNSTGLKTVTVSSSGVSPATCQVQVNAAPVTPPPTPTPLVCTTNQPYTVNSGQAGSFRATGGNGTYSWSASGGSPSTGSGANFSTAFVNNGSTIITKTVYVTSGSQTANCQVHINPAPIAPTNLACTTLTPNVNIYQTARFEASGGSGNYNWSAPDSSVNKTGIGSIFETAYGTAGNKTVVLNDGHNSVNCTVHVNQPVTPPADLFCHLNGPSIVNINDPVSFTATGGTGTYSWNAPSGNPASRSASTNPNFTTVFATAGSKIVRVLSGDHQADCPVVTVRTPVVCVKNVVTSFTHSAIVPVSGSNLYQTTISYNFTGSNPMKITYIDPNDGQEKVFIASVSVSGSQVFSHIEANKTYLFKIYDISSCGDLLDTMVIRKDVSPPQCVPNTNFALNLSAPVKTGSTYSVTITWTSTGSNGINIAKDSTVNIITTGNNTGSFTDTGLAAGTAHTYYMIDAECGQILTATTVVIPSEPVVTPPNNINYCVNNSCNITTNTTNTNYYYYYNNNNNPVPQNEYRALSIEKLVRNVNGGSFQNSISVNANDTVEFQIVVRNTGNQPVNNVRVSDILPFGLSFVSGSFNGNDVSLGTLYTSDSRTLTFQARVNSGSNTSVQNIARVSGDSVDQRQDDAWVFVQGSVAGGSVSLSYSKRAVNDTKNADATSVVASKEDFITYTLTVTNTGNTPATSFVITDDLSQVLPYADMVDNGGGSLNGNVVFYPGITVPANGSVSRSFRVRVKFHLASNLSYTMSNTYGNTVTVRINTPQVLGAFVAPKTGANTAGFAFATLLTAAVGVIKKRKMLMSLIFN